MNAERVLQEIVNNLESEPFRDELGTAGLVTIINRRMVASADMPRIHPGSANWMRARVQIGDALFRITVEKL